MANEPLIQGNVLKYNQSIKLDRWLLTHIFSTTTSWSHFTHEGHNCCNMHYWYRIVSFTDLRLVGRLFHQFTLFCDICSKLYFIWRYLWVYISSPQSSQWSVRLQTSAREFYISNTILETAIKNCLEIHIGKCVSPKITRDRRLRT